MANEKRETGADVLFSKDYGRLNVLRTFVRWPVYAVLWSRARGHLARKRRQLAVFAFDYVGHEINIDGVYELKELDALASWLLKCDPRAFDGAAVDIGANIGNHSVYFADLFRSVHSFEPNPRTFKVLQLNAELAPNIHCYNVGISDTERQASMRVEASNVGGASVADGGGVPITLRTLDSVLDPAEEVKLLKIDVEGHEYQALRGSEATIRRHQPLVLLEQHLKDFEGGKSKSIELLRSFGYTRFATIQNHPRTGDGAPTLARYAYAVLGRMFFGESVRVTLRKEIPPGFYFFLVAIPAWLRTDGG
jgi:FkbM family methyltransferase